MDAKAKAQNDERVVEWLRTRMRTIWTSPCYCAICLASEGEFIALSMEFTGNEETSTIPLREVVNYIFNFNIEDYMPSSQLCEQCTERIIQTYLFIINTKKMFQILNSCINDMHSKVMDINDTLDDDQIYEDSNVMIVVEYDSDTYEKISELTSGNNAILTDKPIVINKKEKPKIVNHHNVFKKVSNKRPIMVPVPRVVKHPRTKEIVIKDVIESRIPTPNVTLKEGKIVIEPLVMNDMPSAPRFNTYYCHSCSDIFTTYRSLKEHEKAKHNTNIFKCKFCSKTYNTQQYLDVHNMAMHNKARCRYCKELFDSSSLNSHLREKHPNNIYGCTHCDLVYYSMEQLQTHVKASHWKMVVPLQSKQQCIMCLKHLIDIETNHKCKFSCLECTNVPCVHYNYLMSYREQILNHASVIKCIDCDFKTKRKEQLIAHVNREHLDYHPFTCNDCKTQFYTKLSLKTHIMQFHQDLKCQYCDSDFRNMKILQSHREICKLVSRPFACEKCVASFDSQDELINHEEISHTKYVYPCTLCNKEFPKESLLEEHHYKIHSGIQNKKRRKIIECTLCDITFRNIKEMIEHEMVHASEQFPCKVCPKTFSSLKKVYLHKQIHYSQRKKCHGCKKPIAESYFSQHVPLCPILRVDKKFECECGKSFDLESTYKKHLKVHNQAEPCIHCGKSIKQSSMNKHLQLKHSAYTENEDPSTSKLLQCEECGYVARKMADFENHVNKIHLKIKPYRCDICNKEFCGKSRLAEHVRTHSTSNTCYCSHCGKKFANKVCLKMHVRRHTGESPYECNICFERFRSSSIMKTHRLKKHQDKTIACPLCAAMYHLVAEMRFHVKKVHWKSKEPFDYKQIVSEEYYHLFQDRRLQKLGDDSIVLDSKEYILS